MPDTASSSLEVTGLACHRARRKLFSGLTFRLAPGEALEIAGPNGSGKTTLMRILAGLRPAESGELRWKDQRVTDVEADYRGALAYLAHESGLKPELTLLENLRSALQVAGQDCTRASAAIQRLGLEKRANQFAVRLSAGQRQRAALARVWASQRPLWLLDEPCAHLDREGRTSVEHLLAEHVRGGGMLIFTTHQHLNLDGVAQRRLELNP